MVAIGFNNNFIFKFLLLFQGILNDLTNFDEILGVCWSGSRNDLYSRFDPVDPTRGGVQTGILRFTVDISVYKWLLLVIAL